MTEELSRHYVNRELDYLGWHGRPLMRQRISGDANDQRTVLHDGKATEIRMGGRRIVQPVLCQDSMVVQGYNAELPFLSLLTDTVGGFTIDDLNGGIPRWPYVAGLTIVPHIVSMLYMGTPPAGAFPWTYNGNVLIQLDLLDDAIHKNILYAWQQLTEVSNFTVADNTPPPADLEINDGVTVKNPLIVVPGYDERLAQTPTAYRLKVVSVTYNPGGGAAATWTVIASAAVKFGTYYIDSEGKKVVYDN